MQTSHTVHRLFSTFLLLVALCVPSILLGGEPVLRNTPRDAAWLQEDLNRLAKDPHNPDLLREVGISYNIVGAPDKWDYFKKAQAALEEANRLRPNDAFTLMFLGSSLALQARNPSVSVLEKGSLVSDGLALMDKAVKLEPTSYRLRLMRATSSIAVPSFFGRSAILEEDVNFVRKTLEPTPPADLPGHQKAAGYLLMGVYHEKKSDLPLARRYWSKAAQIGKGTRYETQAREKLQANEGK